MGCGNQPVFIDLEKEKDESDSSNKPTEADGGGWNPGAYSSADDVMSLPFVSQSYEQFPAHDIQGYEVLPPDLSMRGHGTDRLISPVVTSMDYGKSEIPMNFTPQRRETGTGYPIKTHGSDAQNSRISRFQMSGKYSPSKFSTSLLPLVENFGSTGNTNDSSINQLSSSSPQKIDRNFLTLGIGGGIEARPNRTFSSQEVSNKLEEVSSRYNNHIAGHYPTNPSNITQLAGGSAMVQSNASGFSRPDNYFPARELPNALEEVSSQFNNYNIGHWPTNHMGLTHLSGGNAKTQSNAGGLSTSRSYFHAQAFPGKLEGVSSPWNNYTAMIPTNAGGLSRPASNLASMMPSHVEGELIGDRLNSTSFPGHQKVQANIPSNTPNYTSAYLPTPVSLPSGRTLFPQPNYSSQPEIASTYFASQPVSLQQDYSRKSSMKVTSESSRNNLSHMPKQSFISHAQVQRGDLSLAAEGMRTDVANSGSYPPSIQPVGPGNYISPERIGVQFPNWSTHQSAAAGYFPKRLGLQPNDLASAQSARGPAPVHLDAYLNQPRPLVHRGQHQHGMPVQSTAVFPRVDQPIGQVGPALKRDLTPQVAPIISHPSLKRKAFANPSALSGPQRKIVPQPARNYSAPQQRQKIPSIPVAVNIPPSPPLHVKWEGCDEPREPTGQKCHLCKRDLSFTAEGPVYQPAAPPAVAVLPCGHTFHDHCLQIITPEDELKNPPCIPCAIGET